MSLNNLVKVHKYRINSRPIKVKHIDIGAENIPLVNNIQYPVLSELMGPSPTTSSNLASVPVQCGANTK